MLNYLEISPGDEKRLTEVPVAALIAVTKKLFDEVPSRNPPTLAFVPIIDGD